MNRIDCSISYRVLLHVPSAIIQLAVSYPGPGVPDLSLFGEEEVVLPVKVIIFIKKISPARIKPNIIHFKLFDTH